MITPVRQDGDDTEDRHTQHLPGAMNAQEKSIEVNVDGLKVGKATGVSGVVVCQCGGVLLGDGLGELPLMA